MPPPFPGMNPYLEQEDAWHDFHERFIPFVATVLGSQLRPRYIVKIDEHIYVHELPAASRRSVGRADVSLVRGSRKSASKPVSATNVGLLDAPARVRLPAIDHERLSFIEIRDRRDRELVTVIELLSPANKAPGPDREQYLAKRMELLNGPVHLVEIDLLRGGAPMPAEGRPKCAYSVLVSRVERRLDADLWPIALRDRLPEIPVPVRSPDADARLDLQAVLDRIYDDAGMLITYTRALHVPSWPVKTQSGHVSSSRDRLRERTRDHSASAETLAGAGSSYRPMRLCSSWATKSTCSRELRPCWTSASTA